MAHSTDDYSGLNLNQDKATKPQTVQIVRQGEVTPYWFKRLSERQSHHRLYCIYGIFCIWYRLLCFIIYRTGPNLRFDLKLDVYIQELTRPYPSGHRRIVMRLSVSFIVWCGFYQQSPGRRGNRRYLFFDCRRFELAQSSWGRRYLGTCLIFYPFISLLTEILEITG